MTPKELADRIGRGERWEVLNESKPEVKIPEPVPFMAFKGQRLYSEEQLKQYGDERSREALEMAADVVMMYTPRTGHSSPNWIRSLAIIDAIRALAREIK